MHSFFPSTLLISHSPPAFSGHTQPITLPPSVVARDTQEVGGAGGQTPAPARNLLFPSRLSVALSLSLSLSLSLCITHTNAALKLSVADRTRDRDREMERDKDFMRHLPE